LFCSTSLNIWPRPWPRPLKFGLDLDLKYLASFNISGVMSMCHLLQSLWQHVARHTSDCGWSVYNTASTALYVRTLFSVERLCSAALMTSSVTSSPISCVAVAERIALTDGIGCRRTALHSPGGAAVAKCLRGPTRRRQCVVSCIGRATAILVST